MHLAPRCSQQARQMVHALRISDLERVGTEGNGPRIAFAGEEAAVLLGRHDARSGDRWRKLTRQADPGGERHHPEILCRLERLRVELARVFSRDGIAAASEHGREIVLCARQPRQAAQRVKLIYGGSQVPMRVIAAPEGPSEYPEVAVDRTHR